MSQAFFLQGCGLPTAWAQRKQWCVLAPGFGLGLDFLRTWQAWRADLVRPGLLHFVACESSPGSAADVLRAGQAHPDLAPLANLLAAQWQGLLPGLHRLSFDDGQVLLSLVIGDAKTLFKTQQLTADSVYLDFDPPNTPGAWHADTIKSLTRCCRRGTRLTGRSLERNLVETLSRGGFEVTQSADGGSQSGFLQAHFNPRWEPKKSAHAAPAAGRQPSHCVVVGAGLAGAACAASLARRGWQVTVLDALAFAGGGASSLPAGLLAPHVSPDDSTLSRLTRSGLRATWQIAKTRLREGQDWKAGGVLQRRFESSGALPADWPEAGHHWSREAQPMPGADAPAFTDLWHPAGGWIKPAQLVRALLATPGITTRYGLAVAGLQPMAPSPDGGWQLLDADGEGVARAPLVVLAAGFDCVRLLRQSALVASAPPLQAIRGQLAWGPVPEGAAMPGFAVNGHGNFIPDLALAGQAHRHWLLGATFERDSTSLQARSDDHAAVLARLERLLPATAASLKPMFEDGSAKAWAGVRCATPDHLPLVGSLDEAALPGLHVCTALGSRGLTWAVLCGELLAAWLHAEPLPVARGLARSLQASRFHK